MACVRGFRKKEPTPYTGFRRSAGSGNAAPKSVEGAFGQWKDNYASCRAPLFLKVILIVCAVLALKLDAHLLGADTSGQRR
jgi:hypothetical protein